MAPDGSDPTAPDYLSADQLCIGVFVMIDVPWFAHAFTLNSFKIRTDSQLRELRTMQLPRYRWDPQRSDPLPAWPKSAKPSTQPPAPDPSQVASPPAIATTPDNQAQAERQQRMERIVQRRKNIEQVEKAFTKAAAILKNLNRNLYALPRETLQEMGALVGEIAAVFLNSPEATLHVMGEKVGGEDVYFHSLNVTILAMMLAKELNFTPEQAREMGIGAMLHDVGLCEIPDRISKKSASESTRAERNLRATHIDIGINLGRRIGISALALSVIAQHHEFTDGSGYPQGLDQQAMTPAAQVVSLVNFYDNLCNPGDIAKAMTPHEALSYLFAQCRSKFEPHALHLLIRSLGVHPPGSILQLSNQSLAVVTSVNPQKPLRPWVLLYDENVPKDEAITLNLALEPMISIIKAIRPSQLSPAAAAYLNPRKRVTYFFDADSEQPAGVRR